MYQDREQQDARSRLVRAFAKAWDVLCFVLGGAILLAMISAMATCFGLPSLVDQPTASRLYDLDVVIVSPHAVHPVDRAIHRAAKCSPYMVFDLAADEEGRSIIARASFGPGYRAESHLGRKSGFMKFIAQQSGLVLTRVQSENAKGIRAGYRAGKLDINQLRDLVASGDCD